MSINKVVYDGKTLIDLSLDTVTKESLLKGFTAHKANGDIITGTNNDEINTILTYGLSDGYKLYSDDGTIISTTDSKGRILKKKFSDDFKICTTTLTDLQNNILGKTIRNYQNDELVITTVDSIGQKLIKTFSSNLLVCTSILYNKEGKELAKQIKTISPNGTESQSITTYK